MTAWTSEIGASASATTWKHPGDERDARSRSPTTSTGTAPPRCASGWRMSIVRGRDGAPVLPQEGEVRRKGAAKREQQSEL